MFTREAAKKLKQLAAGFPVVAVTGPRQTGKTTLVRQVFADYEYLSLEDLDVRAEAVADPRGFLARYQDGVVLDEVQHVPALFSYLQTLVDGAGQMGRFVLTGSQNFLLLERVAQSLAGRVGLVELLPLRLDELAELKRPPATLDEWLFTGFFPPVHDRKLTPTDWYPRYVQTYIDRDVRSLKNIPDLATFQKFVRLCAGRIGNLLNLQSLATDCGIAVNTAKSWLSVLEASYLVFRLQPYHRNFSKRLVKHPKLYFCDPGLACALLGLQDASQVAGHYLRGALFENLVLLEHIKSRFNRGLPANWFFWRDNTGHEVDLLVEQGTTLLPVEVKSGETLHPEFYDGLEWFAQVAGLPADAGLLVHGGARGARTARGRAISWRGLSGDFTNP